MNKTNARLSGGWWLCISIIACIGGLFVLKSFTKRPSLSDAISHKTTREVALACTSDMATQFHIHPHLEIIINGERQEIPAKIGIQLTCMNSLHTHDATGKIHVESPEKRDFTLADFFAVWDRPFNKDQILDYKVDDRHRIKETVNGTEIQDFENTVLHDGDQIIITYEGKTH